MEVKKENIFFGRRVSGGEVGRVREVCKRGMPAHMFPTSWFNIFYLKRNWIANKHKAY